MANERLRAAMERSRTTIEVLATKTEVDPKTVGRWLGGRVPHPRHRWTVARFLNEDEEYLWPGARRQPAQVGTADDEIVAAYPFRSNMPKSGWWELIERARHQIDLLGYTLYFLPLDHPLFVETLAKKCAKGCRVRVVIADPASRHVADRDAEEDLAMTLVVRIRTSLKYLRPLLGRDNFELRYQDVPLYNSVFRFDDHMLVTPHLHATPGAAAPLLHLRYLAPNGLFSRFAAHFDSVWDTTVPVSSTDSGDRASV